MIIATISFAIGFVIALIIYSLVIYFNVVHKRQDCPAIPDCPASLDCPAIPDYPATTLQDKIIKSFQNTYEVQMKRDTYPVLKDFLTSFEQTFQKDYEQFFNDNPEYIQYKIIDPTKINNILDIKLNFQKMIRDILLFKLIEENDKKSQTMTIEEQMYWASRKNQIKQNMEQQFGLGRILVNI